MTSGGRVRFGPMLIICVAVSVAAEARAECSAAYTGATLGADLGKLNAAMRQGDRDTIRATGARLTAGLPCTDVVLTVPALASAFRFIGVSLAIAEQPEQAKRYFRSAIELDPSFEWGVEELKLTDPIRVMFEGERDAAGADPVALEGKAFVPLAGSSITVDGRAADEVEATQDRPHLVQVGKDRVATKNYLIDGNAFPDALVGDADAIAARSGGDGGPTRVQRLRPPAKTPLLVVGGTSLLASAGLYAASFATRASFDSATTTDDLLKHQGTTNALVIASGAALLVGVGSGYAGFVLDGGPGIMVHLSY